MGMGRRPWLEAKLPVSLASLGAEVFWLAVAVARFASSVAVRARCASAAAARACSAARASSRACAARASRAARSSPRLRAASALRSASAAFLRASASALRASASALRAASAARRRSSAALRAASAAFFLASASAARRASSALRRRSAASISARINCSIFAFSALYCRCCCASVDWSSACFLLRSVTTTCWLRCCPSSTVCCALPCVSSFPCTTRSPERRLRFSLTACSLAAMI